ncbi:vitamin K epoxide reductase family protein [Amycolatopsis antarctica]|uniref:vitamin K epoxide reductase family protein n=1 Tax=Amycolatopsis antarctica TaxID=1854586 RepID=UPI001F0B3927|nr:vitamin K epoxide reductase family protein [Amycolatopsis antarctica]
MSSTATSTDAPDTAVPTFARTVAWILTIGGAVGSLAATLLLIEKVALLADPSYIPSCSLNPILSCGSVMNTPQAAVFGFPNPILGVLGFPIVTTIGVLLLAGSRVPRWVWLGLQLGATFGVVFVHWLFVQSVYRIGALCPYCMIVWAVTIPIFWYTTLHNLTAGHLPAPGPLRPVTTVLGPIPQCRVDPVVHRADCLDRPGVLDVLVQPAQLDAIAGSRPSIGRNRPARAA